MQIQLESYLPGSSFEINELIRATRKKKVQVGNEDHGRHRHRTSSDSYLSLVCFDLSVFVFLDFELIERPCLERRCFSILHFYLLALTP
jgi:hypothetical protein